MDCKECQFMALIVNMQQTKVTDPKNFIAKALTSFDPTLQDDPHGVISRFIEMDLIDSRVNEFIVESSMCCKNCRFTSKKKDFHTMLNVNINNQKSLMDAVINFMAEELVDDFVCSHCKVKGTMEKKNNILRLPENLIVQLKRYEWERNGAKLCHNVEFPKTLKLRDEFNNEKNYKFKAGILHVGSNIHNGHYLCVCEYNGKLYEFDDSKVRDVSFDDISQSGIYILRYELEDQTEIISKQHLVIELANTNITSSLTPAITAPFTSPLKSLPTVSRSRQNLLKRQKSSELNSKFNFSFSLSSFYISVPKNPLALVRKSVKRKKNVLTSDSDDDDVAKTPIIVPGESKIKNSNLSLKIIRVLACK